MKKPRSDSILKTLHPKAQLELFQFLQANSYDSAIPFAKEKFGVDASRTSLFKFFSWYPFSRQLEEFEDLISQTRKTIADRPELDLDSEQVSKAGQAIFENLAARTQDPKLFIALRRLRQKDRDQAATERKLKLIEAREEKAKKVVNNDKLSPPERQQKLREIFGMGPAPAPK